MKQIIKFLNLFQLPKGCLYFGPAAAALIPAIAAVVGSAVNAISSARQNKKTNDANMRLAKYQYEMNSPVNQMAQYKEAGLNPNLIYGSGSGAAAKYDAPSVDYRRPPIDFPNMIAMYQDVQLKQEQIRNMSAQTQSLTQRTINEKLRSPILDSEGKIKLNQISRSQWDAVKAEFDAKISQNKVSMQPLEMVKLGNQAELIQQQLTNAQLDAVYKRYTNEFMSMGIRPNDHIGIRMAIKIMQAAGINIESLLK